MKWFGICSTPCNGQVFRARGKRLVFFSPGKGNGLQPIPSGSNPSTEKEVMKMSKGVSDYSDGRLFPGRPIAPHLRPEAFPLREKQTVSPSVKIRRNGREIRCLEIDGERFALQAI